MSIEPMHGKREEVGETVSKNQNVEMLVPRLSSEKEALALSIADAILHDPYGADARFDSEGGETLPYPDNEIIEIYEFALMKAVAQERMRKSTILQPAAFLMSVVKAHQISEDVLTRPSMRAIIEKNDWDWVRDHCVR